MGSAVSQCDQKWISANIHLEPREISRCNWMGNSRPGLVSDDPQLREMIIKIK